MGMFENLIVGGVKNILFWKYIKIILFILKKLFLIII